MDLSRWAEAQVAEALQGPMGTVSDPGGPKLAKYPQEVPQTCITTCRSGDSAYRARPAVKRGTGYPPGEAPTMAWSLDPSITWPSCLLWTA